MQSRAAKLDTEYYSTMNLACPWRGLNVFPTGNYEPGDACAVMFLSSVVFPSEEVGPEAPLAGVGFHLPDWGMRYLIADMAEDIERARGLPTRTERPAMPVPSEDWGQIILTRRMETDEEEV